MYPENARKDYLNITKCKKRTSKKIRKAIKQQLQYIIHDRRYIEEFLLAGCELSGKQARRLGRPSKTAKVNKKQEYIDNADRIEVERRFALCKHKYGLGLVTTKLDETTRHSIALSVLVMNVDRILATSLCLISILKFSRNKLQKFL